jgi:hypothetical protein
MEIATIYNSSSGPKSIPAMNEHNVRAAHAKLLRERRDESRDNEIHGLAQRIAEFDAVAPDEPNPRAVIGGNEPPEPTPVEKPPEAVANGYGAIKVHIDDLLIEAHNWADGVKVENQAQADEISRLIDDLSKALGIADDARVGEKQPFDAIIDEIQARYNFYIAPLKNKKPGKVPLAIEALKAALKPFLDAEKAKADQIAATARAEAQRLADEAAAAMRAAEVSNLAERDAAEEKVDLAQAAAQVAKQAEAVKVHAHGGERALGLKTSWTPVMVDQKAAVLFYMKRNARDFIDLVQRLAEQDVRAGLRQIPGFDVQQGTRL